MPSLYETWTLAGSRPVARGRLRETPGQGFPYPPTPAGSQILAPIQGAGEHLRLGARGLRQPAFSGAIPPASNPRDEKGEGEGDDLPLAAFHSPALALFDKLS